MAIWLVPTLVSLFLYGIGQGLVKKYISEVPPARFCLYFVVARTVLNLSYYARFHRAELPSTVGSAFAGTCLLAYVLDGLGWLLYFQAIVYGPIGIVGTFYIYGEIFKDPRAKTTALDAISATAIASGIVTNSFKYVIGRGRPTDGKGAYNFRPFSGQDSFSSGHTTEAFALASVISEHYDTPWVQVTSYGLASAVGYARLNNNRHWPSDVLAGATIGTFVGKTVVHFNARHRQVKVQPIVGPNVHGVEMSLGW